MNKFTNWLINNEFSITSKYDIYENTMRFEKGVLKFIVIPTYKGSSVLYTISVRENEYTKYVYESESRQLCWEVKTQKELIRKLDKYMKENQKEIISSI